MIRGIWDRETVALMLLATAFPIAAMWLWDQGLDGVVRLAFFLVVSGIWHLIFMLARAQPPSFAGALTALAIAILAPEELGVLPLLLGTSFGVVMAELAFGGWGRNVVNPATITLAFLGFGFPAAPWPDLAIPVGWAAIPAVLIGVVFGVMSLRIVLGAVVVLGGAMYLGVPLQDWIAALAVVLVLIVCDPVVSANTSIGRWLNGALFGAIALLFATQWADVAPVQAAVTAALLTGLAAPLLDEIAVAIWLARRRKRLG